MIDEQCKHASDKFTVIWAELLKEYPRFTLDGSWPSIGTVDRLLAHLRRKEELNAMDLALLQGAAAYIGKFAHDCWKRFTTSEVSLTAYDEPTLEFTLRANRGAYLTEGQKFSVPLVKTLRRVLSDTSPETPFFADGMRMAGPEDNLLSVFAAGLASGLCPYGYGPWKDKPIEDFAGNLEIAAHYMAASAAHYYERCFPLEKLGAMPELYHPHLVLPPAGYHEPHPALRGVAGMLNFARVKELDLHSIAKLAGNLMLSPDELISSVGFAVTVAMNEDSIPTHAKSYGISRGLSISFLRPAVSLARELLGRRATVTLCLRQNEQEEARTLIAREYEARLLPLFYLPDTTIALRHEFDAFLNFLVWNQVTEASEVLDLFRLVEDLSPALQLQRAFLSLMAGQREEAKNILTFVPEEQRNTGDVGFRYNQLQSKLAEYEGDQDGAAAFLEDALVAGSKDNSRVSEACSWLAAYYSTHERYEEAEQILDEALRREPTSQSAWFNLLMLFKTKGYNEECERFFRQLYEISGCMSLSVFSLLQSHVLDQRVLRKAESAE